VFKDVFRRAKALQSTSQGEWSPYKQETHIHKKYMAKRLYVGGLPYSTTDAELKEAFEKVIPVQSASIIIDKMSGRSRGFGFVEVVNDNDVEKAIETMNGKEFGGRTLTVNEARPMESRDSRDSRPRGGFGGGRRDY
jgi:RNA recognition motif-containing protein